MPDNILRAESTVKINHLTQILRRTKRQILRRTKRQAADCSLFEQITDLLFHLCTPKVPVCMFITEIEKANTQSFIIPTTCFSPTCKHRELKHREQERKVNEQTNLSEMVSCSVNQ